MLLHDNDDIATRGMERIKLLWEVVIEAEQMVKNKEGSHWPLIAAQLEELSWTREPMVREGDAELYYADYVMDADLHEYFRQWFCKSFHDKWTMEDAFNDVKDMLRITNSSKFSKHHTWWEIATARSLQVHPKSLTNVMLGPADWAKPSPVPAYRITDQMFDARDHVVAWTNVTIDNIQMKTNKNPVKYRKAGPLALKKEAASTAVLVRASQLGWHVLCEAWTSCILFNGGV
eukprot:5061866-Karenia_brevis.AAC.1